MNARFKFISDPSHGWLEVKLDDVQSVELSVEDFSTCSYRNGNVLYLEEDRDAPLFLMALKDLGVKPNIEGEFIERNCFVRKLKPIR